ncbi:MAG: peptide chain release factor N(5)-glutamine methyltransferase [Opitutaceae bacterium]
MSPAEMFTVLEIIKKTTEFFAAKGIESPRLNAELLIGHALALKRMQLYLEFERPLSELELEKVRPLVRRRAQHEPVQYILGETDFFGLKLKVDRRVLIPRPETEELVGHATRAVGASAPARILDLGTGSGAIALALAHTFPAARVVAVDRSEDALALARENAVSTGLDGRVTFLISNWFEMLPSGTFDLVVSNPPYLTAEETAQTSPEVRGFEPVEALTAADDGLADLAAIISNAPRYLAPGGLLALETGVAQRERLLALTKSAGFNRSEARPDLTGRDRFLLAYR